MSICVDGTKATKICIDGTGICAGNGKVCVDGTNANHSCGTPLACPGAQTQNLTLAQVVNYTTGPAVTGGGGPGTISLFASPLPAGIAFADNGDGTGTFSGTLSEPAGTVTTTVTAASGAFACAFGVSWVIAGAPGVTCPANFTSTGQTGNSVAFTTAAAGGGTGPVVLTQTGLPAGVTFTDNGDGTATFGGVFPAVGSFPVNITATQGASTCNWTVTLVSTGAAGSPPTCPATQATTASVGTAVSFTTPAVVSASAITLTFAGVPAGMTMTDNGDGTATLSGNAPGTVGTNTIVVTANTVGGTCGFNLDLTTQALPTVGASVCEGSGTGAPLSLFSWNTNVDASTAVLTRYHIATSVAPQGGSGGPYTVDFSGITFDMDWGISGLAGFAWQVQQRTVAGTGPWLPTGPSGAAAGGGNGLTVPAGAVATGVPTGGEARIMMRPNVLSISNSGASLFLSGTITGGNASVSDTSSATGVGSVSGSCGGFAIILDQ